MPSDKKIRILSNHVANKIAAGEVVDRPASIVKELVENAIDSEATQIDVIVTAGGRKLVSINDNGIGMSRDDLSAGKKCRRGNNDSGRQNTGCRRYRMSVRNLYRG